MKTYKECDILTTILGTEYTVHIWPESKEQRFQELNCDGFCDPTTKELFISNYIDSNKKINVSDPLYAIRHTIRHEMVHAFMYESGLGEDWEHGDVGQEETVVDWIARQIDKMHENMEIVINAIKENEIEV